MFQVLWVRLCAVLAGTTWKTHVQKYLRHFSPSEGDWDHCRRDALHIQGKADRLLPFTILPRSLPSGSCRRTLSITKQGKHYQAFTQENQSPEWKSNLNQIFSIYFLVTATFIHPISYPFHTRKEQQSLYFHSHVLIRSRKRSEKQKDKASKKNMFHSTCIDTTQSIQSLSSNYL